MSLAPWGRKQWHTRRMCAVPVADGDRDGRDVRWDRHRAKRLRLILDAAAEVVDQAPPGADLRLQHVAMRAGLTRPIVRRYLGGAASLTRALQSDLLRRAQTLTVQTLGTAVSLRAGVSQLVEMFMDWVEAHPSLFAILQAAPGPGEPKELDLAVRTTVDRLVAAVESFDQDRSRTLSAADIAKIEISVHGALGQLRATLAPWASLGVPRLDHSRVHHLLTESFTATMVHVGKELGIPLSAERHVRLGAGEQR